MASKDFLGNRGSLLVFPVEILCMICKNLCNHCDPVIENVCPYDEKNEAALLALSQTCKTLQCIAQPVLYHSILYPPAQYTPLIRTLDERPDLALQVKRLSQKPYTYTDMLYSGEDLKFLKAVARRLGMGHEEDPDFESVAENEDVATQFSFHLLFALLPNLEVMEVAVETEGSVNDNQLYFLDQHLAKLDPEGAGKMLKRLEFHPDDDQSIQADSPSIVALLKASPNLEELLIMGGIAPRNGQLLPGSASKFLRSVELNHFTLGEDYESSCNIIRNIIAHAPSLECFFYVAQQEGYRFSMSQLLGLLKPVKSTLKHLDVDLALQAYKAEPTDVIGEGAFLPFSKLENLSIDETCFCMHHHEPATSPTCIAKFIPPSLENLELRLFEDTFAWEDLEALCVEAIRFPNLKSIFVTVIPRSDQDEDEDGEVVGLLSTMDRLGFGLKLIFLLFKIRFMVYDATSGVSMAVELRRFVRESPTPST